MFLDGMSDEPAGSSCWNRIPAKTEEFQLTAKASPPDKIGPLVLRYCSVGHSIFGATTFAVQTSEAWPAYTGDLRHHGAAQADTEHFMDEVQKLHPLALLCEGTRAGDEKRVTEDKVYENAWREIGPAKGLVVADFGPRNVEGLLTFLRIARETVRKLLVLGKDAYRLEAMHLASPQRVPDIWTVPISWSPRTPRLLCNPGERNSVSDMAQAVWERRMSACS